MDMTAPVYWRDRTRSEIHAAQGKPETLPETAGDPQGTLLPLRVKEYGKKPRPVCGPQCPVTTALSQGDELLNEPALG